MAPPLSPVSGNTPQVVEGPLPGLKPRFVKPKDVQKAITRTMTDALDAGLVVGWASAVGRVDGLARDAEGAGGFAKATLPFVTMSPDMAQAIGSCSKTITAVAALAATWALRTKFGALKPQGKALKDIQDEALNQHLSKFLPSEFDKSRIDGSGGKLILPPFQPQKVPITFKHALQYRSYLLTEVKPYSGPGAVPDGGYYVNLEKNLQVGPVFKPPTNVTIGAGIGRYSNQAYHLFRLAIPYLLGSDQSLVAQTMAPPRDALNAAPKSVREVVTATVYVDFVLKHVLAPCGVTAATVNPTEPICYYNIDGHGTDQFEYREEDSRLLTSGGDGWHISAKDLHKFLVGVQRGKPFGGDSSWWHDVIRPNEIGTDPSWLSQRDQNFAKIDLPSGTAVRAYQKNGLADFPLGAQAQCQWLITSDGVTSVLVINSGSKNARGDGVPSLLDVLRKAYIDAA